LLQPAAQTGAISRRRRVLPKTYRYHTAS
jgi:hypothetical protein